MRFIKIILAAAALLAAPVAYASDTSVGHITRVQQQGGNGGKLFIDVDGTRTTLASCAASQPTRWVVDVSTSSGQMMAATILTAFSQRKPMYIYGTGTCAEFAGTESILLLVVDG